MATSETVSAALKTAQEDLAKVISDLQERPDYSSNSDFQGYVATFQTYNQLLLTAQAETSLTAGTSTALINGATNDVLPVIQTLIDGNIAMINMGQLNTDRTISPKLATENNANLTAAQSSLQQLVAVLSAEQSTPAPTPAPAPAPAPTPEPAPESTSDTAEILPETEVVSRFSRWASSLGGNDDAS